MCLATQLQQENSKMKLCKEQKSLQSVEKKRDILLMNPVMQSTDKSAPLNIVDPNVLYPFHHLDLYPSHIPYPSVFLGLILVLVLYFSLSHRRWHHDEADSEE